MNVTASSHADQAALLNAAMSGDHQAFQTLVAAHCPALHVHCYRMLGSFHDAEDATQETLLQAWRSFATYEQRGPLRHWLYRIATTTCLKILARRRREPVSVADVTFLQPYPDRLLDQLRPVDGDPAAAAELRESVALAFIAALQCIPATQRAVLILRDVLAWPAAEVAELLGTTAAAVNSALQRARAALSTAQSGRPAPGWGRRGPMDARDREVVHRFVSAWQACDVAALAALLREDAILRMPPEQVELRGRRAVVDFFATVPAGGRLDQIELVLTAANGQPALAAYLRGDSDPKPYGLMLLSVRDGGIVDITGFPEPSLFRAFGLSRPSSKPHRSTPGPP